VVLGRPTRAPRQPFWGQSPGPPGPQPCTGLWPTPIPDNPFAGVHRPEQSFDNFCASDLCVGHVHGVFGVVSSTLALPTPPTPHLHPTLHPHHPQHHHRVCNTHTRQSAPTMGPQFQKELYGMLQQLLSQQSSGPAAPQVSPSPAPQLFTPSHFVESRTSAAMQTPGQPHPNLMGSYGTAQQPVVRPSGHPQTQTSIFASPSEPSRPVASYATPQSVDTSQVAGHSYDPPRQVPRCTCKDSLVSGHGFSWRSPCMSGHIAQYTIRSLLETNQSQPRPPCLLDMGTQVTPQVHPFQLPPSLWSWDRPRSAIHNMRTALPKQNRSRSRLRLCRHQDTSAIVTGTTTNAHELAATMAAAQHARQSVPHLDLSAVSPYAEQPMVSQYAERPAAPVVSRYVEQPAAPVVSRYVEQPAAPVVTIWKRA
jgi:hypothetical protein